MVTRGNPYQIRTKAQKEEIAKAVEAIAGSKTPKRGQDQIKARAAEKAAVKKAEQEADKAERKAKEVVEDKSKVAKPKSLGRDMAPAPKSIHERPIREPFKRPTMKDLPEGWQDTLLAELSVIPVVTRAARIAGVSRRTAYQYFKEDPEFKEAWECAVAEGKERHAEMCSEMAQSGNVTMAIYLDKKWNGHGGAEDVDMNKGPKTKHISVGWD